MNRTILKLAAACSLLGLAAITQADPAVYRDSVMTIDSGVLINGSIQQYYTDIVLKADATGKLRIDSANQLPLVHIDDVTPVVVENANERSVTLTITGYKSVPCVSLADVAVSYQNKAFTVLVAETLMGPAESCIAMIDPFEIEQPLDVSELPKGVYHTLVNGEHIGFSLTTDPLVTAH